MKIRRDTLKQAKSLLRLCFTDQQLDQGKARAVIDAILRTKPRDMVGLLQGLLLLLKLETRKRTIRVSSATPLHDQGASIFSQMEKAHGSALLKIYQIDPLLVGGLRIQVGSNVWDGSISQHLQTLQTAIH